MAGIWMKVKEKCSVKKWMKRWKACGRKKKTIIVLAAVVLFAGIGGTVFYFGRNPGRDAFAGSVVTEVTAQSGEISNTVVGTGNLEAGVSSSMKIPSGLVIEEVLVESGDHVSAGDTLATVSEVSVLDSLQSVQEAMTELDKEIQSVQDNPEEEKITAGVSGRVKRIYVSEGGDVSDCILTNGALVLLSADGELAVKIESASAPAKGSSVVIWQSEGASRTGTVESAGGDSCIVTFSDQGIGVDETVTVTDADGNTLGSGQAYIHQAIQVTAVGGAVTEICVSEDESVSAGDTLLIIEGSTQSMQYRELTAEREAMAVTLKKLLAISKTGTITAETDGTVEEINVSGGTTSGSTSSVSQSSTTASQSISASRMSWHMDETAGEAMTDGTEGIMLLAADTGTASEAGSENAATPKSPEYAGNTENTEAAGGNGDAADDKNTGNTEDTGEADGGKPADTQKLSLTVKGTGSSSANSLVIESPVKGNKAQTGISAGDGSYSGTVTWNPQDESFRAETVYKAEITLYASDLYHFETDSILSVETGIASGVSVSDDRKTLAFQLTFPSTEKEESCGGNDTQGKPGQEEGSANSGMTGNSGTAGENGSAGGQNTFSGTGSGFGTGSGTAVNAGSGTGSGTVSGTTGTGSTDSTEYSTDIAAFGIASDENMVLSVSVDELDINSISKSQEAEITLDAIEGETYTGTVTKIGNSAGISGGVTKYTVQITLPKDTRMKTGMNASATIVIEKKENVVTIPVNALQERGNETFVYTEKSSDGTLSGEKTVTTGISDGDMVEITEGLSEGDTVYYQKTGNTGDTTFGSFGRDGEGMPDMGDFNPFSDGKNSMPEGMPDGQNMPFGE